MLVEDHYKIEDESKQIRGEMKISLKPFGKVSGLRFSIQCRLFG